VSAVCALLCLLYVVAVGLRAGREAESAVFVNPAAVGDSLFGTAIATVSPWTLTVVMVVATFLAARQDGLRAGIAVATIVAGANASTFGLKRALGALDPLRGETHRVLGDGFFPSGHATAAMSLGCALVAAAPPARARLAALAAGAYASAVGVALTAPANHHPSDVIGGMLVTAAWAELARAAKPSTSEPSCPRRDRRAGALGALLSAAGGGITAVVSGVRPQEHLELMLACALVIGTAFVVACGEAPPRRQP
jgi:membrane-associated phospholipid phosphatase